MREAYHGELRRLSAELQALCGLAVDAMRRATEALLGQDLTRAEQVIADDAEIDRAYREFDRAACSVLALEAPVAGELRAVISMIQVGEKAMRMGDLARHVAEVARRRHPERAVPSPLTAQFAEMGALCVSISHRIELAIAAPLQLRIDELERLDDRIDRLEAEALAWASNEDLGGDVRSGVDVALLARYFERYADQGVGAGRKLRFAATGDRSRVRHGTP
jgi:phosphate transport system protein